MLCARGSVVEAVAALVRGKSPFLSLVPEERSRVGDAARLEVVFAIPFRRVYRAVSSAAGPQNSIFCGRVFHDQTTSGPPVPAQDYGTNDRSQPRCSRNRRRFGTALGIGSRRSLRPALPAVRHVHAGAAAAAGLAGGL